MAFAWIAAQGTKVIAEGGGRIPTSENPDFGSTTAEAIGMLAAYKATEAMPNRKFYCDSESLCDLTRSRKVSSNQTLAKLIHCIPITAEFNNTSEHINHVDRMSKRPNLYPSVRLAELLDFGNVQEL
jgi:hypothetical protein